MEPHTCWLPMDPSVENVALADFDSAVLLKKKKSQPSILFNLRKWYSFGKIETQTC